MEWRSEGYINERSFHCGKKKSEDSVFNFNPPPPKWQKVNREDNEPETVHNKWKNQSYFHLLSALKKKMDAEGGRGSYTKVFIFFN